jgi:hydrogenase-1 operon protein HyaF
MTDFSFLADDALVDALIMEIAGLLRRLIEHGEAGIIDVLGLPLPPSCVASLEQRLGHGEVTVRLDAAGASEIRETGIPGVWWTRHSNEQGRLVAMLIEVTFVPEILKANIADVVRGAERLPALTNVALRARGADVALRARGAGRPHDAS